MNTPPTLKHVLPHEPERKMFTTFAEQIHIYTAIEKTNRLQKRIVLKSMLIIGLEIVLIASALKVLLLFTFPELANSLIDTLLTAGIWTILTQFHRKKIVKKIKATYDTLTEKAKEQAQQSLASLTQHDYDTIQQMKPIIALFSQGACRKPNLKKALHEYYPEGPNITDWHPMKLMYKYFS